MFTCDDCGRKAKSKVTIKNCKHKNKQPNSTNLDVSNLEEPNTEVIYIKSNLNYNGIVKGVVHLSDIHVRLSERHEEYREVFSKLYTSLSMLDKDHIIVITGDCLYTKDLLTPDCIVLFVEFVTRLSEIFPLFIIAGNHDTLETNRSRIDSISGILKDRSISNLYYLRDSGIYQYGNILFGVSSLLIPMDSNQTKPVFIQYEYLNQYIIENQLINPITIALYHGQVGSPITSEGKTLSGIPISNFDGYDYVMLGDIHKYQFLNPQKTIAYSSSLISQNFGEFDDDHGYLLWNLNDKTSEYIRIPNDYAFKKYKLVGTQLKIDQCLYDFDNLPPTIPIKGNIRLEVSKDTCIEEEMNAKNAMRQLYPQAQFDFISSRIKTFLDKSMDIDETTKDLNIEIHKYLVTKYPDISIEDIDFVIKEVDINNPAKKLSQNVLNNQWEMVYLKFSYMFGYGENNVLDFTKLPTGDIVGLFANNGYGKSSIIDICSFMLYSMTTRNISNRKHIQPDIIHVNQNEAHGELIIKVGNKSYLITKKCKRNKSNDIKVLSDLYELEEYSIVDGDLTYTKKKCLTEQHRIDTDKEIVKLLGTHEDFLFQSISLQFDNKSFRSMAPRVRKDFLYRIFKLDIFVEQLELVKNQKKKYEIQLKTTKDELGTINRVECQSGLDEISAKLETDNIHKQNLLEKQDCLKKSRDNLLINSSINPIESIDEIKKKLTAKTVTKHILETELSEAKSKLESLDLSQSPYMEVSQNEINNINIEIEKLQGMKRPIHEIKDDISGLDELRKVKEDLEDNIGTYNALGKPIENLTIKFNKRRIELEELLSSKKKPNKSKDVLTLELEEKRDEMTKLGLGELSKSLECLENIVVRWNKYQSILELRNKTTNSLEELKVLMCDLEKHEYDPNCNYCIKNPMTVQLCKKQKEYRDLELTQSMYKSQLLEYSTIETEYMEIMKREKEYNSGLDRELELRDEIMVIEEDLEYLVIFEKLKSHLDDYNNNELVIEYNRLKMEIDQSELCLKKGNLEKLEHTSELVKKNEENILYNNEIDKKLFIIRNERDMLNNVYNKMLERLKMEKEVSLLEGIIEKGNLELKSIEMDISKYEIDCINYEKSREIMFELCKLDNELSDIGKELMLLDDNRQSQLKLRYELEMKVVHYDDLLFRCGEMEMALRRYGYMYDLVSREGISLYLLGGYLETISKNVNKIISDFINKKVEIKIMNDDIVINCYPKYGNGYAKGSVELCGGAESVIFDLAYKIVLGYMARLPKSNMLIIDEGLSAFDQNSISNIEKLFNFMKIYYEKVLIVSHIDVIKNNIRNRLGILKKGDYSYLDSIICSGI